MGDLNFFEETHKIADKKSEIDPSRTQYFEDLKDHHSPTPSDINIHGKS